MIVVVASRRDGAAERLVASWGLESSALLRAEDLSAQGWRVEYPPGNSGQAVVSGRVLPEDAVRGVLVRLPVVTEDEIPRISQEDRAYVAAEMTAFLVAWLSSLACPVLNRPCPTNLLGPNLRNEQWVQMAARLGFMVEAVRRQHQLGGSDPVAASPVGMTTVFVVGERSLGAASARQASTALRLARAAGVELLRVHFRGDAVAGADYAMDLDDRRIVEALAARFQLPV